VRRKRSVQTAGTIAGTVLISATTQSCAMPTLTQIAVVFTRYANLTVGGGSATTATMHGELVEKRRWLTDDQFTLSFALGRVTPGTSFLAFCTGFGYVLRGLPGAIVALLASSIPCAVRRLCLLAR
jgi:chromate transporter